MAKNEKQEKSAEKAMARGQGGASPLRLE